MKNRANSLLIFFTLLYGLGGFMAVKAQEPFPPLVPAFTDTEVPRVNIILPPDSLALILLPGNELSDYHYHATFVYTTTTFADTLYDVGFRLRGNTSRFAQKKSYKISFNTYLPGREFYGLEKFNLNGEHNDPSIIRSKLGWDLLRNTGIPAPRANHVALYINQQYFGLYTNVEHIDEEFAASLFGNKNGNLYKCLWPADLDYLGSNPDLYKLEIGGRRVYDLKTNTTTDDYSDLADFIHVLNQIPDDQAFRCALEEIFNVEAYLKVIAFDILTANWDGPIFNKNNFYLYHNTLTDKFEYIPYDLDNTFGIDWLGVDWGMRNLYTWPPPGEPRPIFTRLMAIDVYRDQFSYYLNQMLQDIFNTTTFYDRINDLKTMITPFAVVDSFRTLDYGYSVTDFNVSYFAPLGGHVDYGLTHYINTRRNSALVQLNIQDIFPVISNITNNFPGLDESIIITAEVEDEAAPTVELHYQLNGGSIIIATMFDDGQHADGAAGDGAYGIILPGVTFVTTFNYFIEALDNQGQESRQPFCTDLAFEIEAAVPTVRINEFMAANNTIYADEFGEYDDWIELLNTGLDPVYLGDKYLTDDLNWPNRWQMPDMYIYPGQYLIFWADDQGFQGNRHTNFKLKKEGEQLGLFNAVNTGFAVIDTLSYGPQSDDQATGRLPNGTGPFQTLVPATPGASNGSVVATESIEGMEIYQHMTVWPNPFNDRARILIQLNHPAAIKIQIMNALGQQVWKNQFQAQSERLEFEWTGKNSLGNPLPAGVYHVMAELKDRDGHFQSKISKKVVLIR